MPTAMPTGMQYDEFDHRIRTPVYAYALKDVPPELRKYYWLAPIKFDQLSKLQLKVRMCCLKCEEKVKEEIWEVPGVFEVRAMRPKKVIVVSMPDPLGGHFGFDKNEVLRKAKKIDCRAKIVELDPTERPKPPKTRDPDGKPPPPPNPIQVTKPTGRVDNTAYHPTFHQASTSWSGEPGRPSEPPYQEDYYMHYFHLLLLALFVSLLLLR